MKYSIVTLILSLISLTTIAQDAGTLEIEGFATYRNGGLGRVQIEVYKDGQEYIETQTDRSGKFELLFEGEGNYIVKASKEGYHDRYILFNTHVDKKGYKKEKYDFGLELFKTRDENVDAQVQEIPVIEFNPAKRNFSYAAML